MAESCLRRRLAQLNKFFTPYDESCLICLLGSLVASMADGGSCRTWEVETAKPKRWTRQQKRELKTRQAQEHQSGIPCLTCTQVAHHSPLKVRLECHWCSCEYSLSMWRCDGCASFLCYRCLTQRPPRSHSSEEHYESDNECQDVWQPMVLLPGYRSDSDDEEVTNVMQAVLEYLVIDEDCENQPEDDLQEAVLREGGEFAPSILRGAARGSDEELIKPADVAHEPEKLIMPAEVALVPMSSHHLSNELEELILPAEVARVPMSSHHLANESEELILPAEVTLVPMSNHHQPMPTTSPSPEPESVPSGLHELD